MHVFYHIIALFSCRVNNMKNDYESLSTGCQGLYQKVVMYKEAQKP